MVAIKDSTVVLCKIIYRDFFHDKKSPSFSARLGLSTITSDQSGILNKRSCLYRSVKTKVNRRITSLELSDSQLKIPQR